MDGIGAIWVRIARFRFSGVRRAARSAPPAARAQREAIYRLRYDTYVEKMNCYRSIADHYGRPSCER